MSSGIFHRVTIENQIAKETLGIGLGALGMGLRRCVSALTVSAVDGESALAAMGVCVAMENPLGLKESVLLYIYGQRVKVFGRFWGIGGFF